MGQSHPSTPQERVQSASFMLAHSGQYGIVTTLSRALGVSRPTLYAWKAQAQQALAQAFCAPPTLTCLSRGLGDVYKRQSLLCAGEARAQ